MKEILQAWSAVPRPLGMKVSGTLMVQCGRSSSACSLSRSNRKLFVFDSSGMRRSVSSVGFVNVIS